MFEFFKSSSLAEWELDQKILPEVKILNSELVSIKNIRNFNYCAEFDYDISYYDRTFDLRDIQSAIIGLVPFSKNPWIIHALLKFTFENKEEVVFSIEIRKKKGQKFSTLKTIFPFYQIMYVIANPHDVVTLRTNFRKNEPVYFHELDLTNEEVRHLFLDMSLRAQRLCTNPEMFTIFSNSCTSNLIGHINKTTHYKIPWFYKNFAPGLLFKYFKITK